VVWEWTGQGGQHNVVADSGADFESELADEEGATFEQTVEEDALVTYFCRPHDSVGMRGVVVVGEPPSPTPIDTPADFETPGGTPIESRTPRLRTAVVGVVASVGLVASVLATLYLVFLGEQQSGE